MFHAMMPPVTYRYMPSHAVTCRYIPLQFVGMMYELWDETRAGALDAERFDRAAHQHPLLVQVAPPSSRPLVISRASDAYTYRCTYATRHAHNDESRAHTHVHAAAAAATTHHPPSDVRTQRTQRTHRI